MYPPEVDYLNEQIMRHAALFFGGNVAHLLDNGLVRFVRLSDLNDVQDPVIAIPYDIPIPDAQRSPYKVEFSGTALTLWNRVPPPSSRDWEAIPSDNKPLWYVNRSGTSVPGWNLFGNLFRLLTFGEEDLISERDHHGRFAAALSPRLMHGLLEIPAFNEAVAAIAGGVIGLRVNGRPSLDIRGLVKPPVVTLSHDCDILRGNDIWTQSVRGARIFLPLKKGKLPAIRNAWWIARNAVAPRAHYFDNATGMIDIESCFGYNSIFYILNGRSGRFGARSGLPVVSELLRRIPQGWGIGMHYNYDTFLDGARFGDQRNQLRAIVGSDIEVGRAHYLRFDPRRSLVFLRNNGIRVDESSGYPDRIGFRNGIAGGFQVFDPISRKKHEIWEVPLTIMDEVLVDQCGEGAIRVFCCILNHLRCIGGALSIVFHPGQFFNPEYPRLMGIYHRMLIECRQAGAASMTAAKLIESFRSLQLPS